MKEQLELKHIAPYLPYGLKVSPIHTLHGHTGIGSIEHIVQAVNEGKLQYRPILRPLSDLTKEIEHNGEMFVPYDVLRDMELKDMRLHSDGCLTIHQRNIQNCEYWRMVKLFEWHFDVFGLIDKGLAISYEEAGL